MSYRSSRAATSNGGDSYLVKQNDNLIDGLNGKVTKLKECVLEIGEEVRNQNKLLNSIGNEFDSSEGILSATMKKLGFVSIASRRGVIPYLIGFMFLVFLCIYLIVRYFKD